jgi:AcrR family transcriptional regulator
MATTNYHHGDLKNALIQAGVKILAREGVSGLSLRKVAKQAGVSHAAPYSHFADKQALIAAISTEGFKQLHTQIEDISSVNKTNPAALLVETAWAYMQFALNEPDRFKLMFSSVLEKEKEYPDFVEYSQKNFSQIVEVVKICQFAEILHAGPAEITAVGVWSTVHGLIMLILEGQIPHSMLDQFGMKEMLIFTLNQLTLVELRA